MTDLYVFIDPDEQVVETRSFSLDVETLCEVLRCDATEVVQITEELVGYIDGEGAWQGRQTEWQLLGEPCWGPMLIFRGLDPETQSVIPCTDKDLDLIETSIHFYEEL